MDSNISLQKTHKTNINLSQYYMSYHSVLFFIVCLFYDLLRDFEHK